MQASLQGKTPGRSLLQRRHLDVEGGREESQDGERERKGRGARLARVLLRATSVSLLLGGANSVSLQLFHSPDHLSQDLRPQ